MAKTKPYLLIIVLLICTICSGLMCSLYANSTDFTSQQLSIKNGSTVVNGDEIVNVATIQKIPLTANPSNIIRPLTKFDVLTLLTAVTTGTVPKDVIDDDTYVTSDGKVSDNLEGPGIITCNENGKISVVQTNQMVWGHKLPYTYAVKEGDSIKLVQNNTTIKTLTSSEINNDTVPTDYVSAKELQNWFKTAKDGSEISVDYYLGNFSDNRSGVYGKENIIKDFGEDSYGYMRNYTSGAPVLVYEHNATKTNVSSAVSVVKDLAGYPTEIRAANAKEFARGWNNTIVPPHSSAHGKENVTFTAIEESEAASGSATHGVCPPGRSLRDALLALGNPLPVGMSGAEESILYDYRPTVDVLVTNNGDYPIKIVMWTEGEGGATTIYTTIYELKDNNTYVSNSNSTNN